MSGGRGGEGGKDGLRVYANIWQRENTVSLWRTQSM